MQADTQSFLLRVAKLLIKIYYDILQLPEEVHFHHGQVSAENRADQMPGTFCLQCTPDLYVSITPVSFSSHVALKGTGLYGFVDASEDSRSHCALPELTYTEVDTRQRGFEIAGPFYQYRCVDSPIPATHSLSTRIGVTAVTSLKL